MSDLEELDVVKATLRSVESSSDGFYLAPDVDECLGASRSRDSGIFEVGEHKIKFSALKETYTFLGMPGVSPSILLGQGIPFGLSLCPGEVKDIPNLFFKEEDLFYRSSLIGLDHLKDEEMFL